MFEGGTPRISIIIASYSFSFSPGNKGKPIYKEWYKKLIIKPLKSSAIIQPKLHISIFIVYGIPRIISGAR